MRLAHEVSAEPTERELDVLLATGEQTTIALLAMAIDAQGAEAVSLTGAQAGIVTDGWHTQAKIANISPKQIVHLLDAGAIVIVAGFQGQTLEGQVTTLGRGGSDLTAIAIASAINADLCQIFTDVDGVYTCDPRLVPTARQLEELSYEEMLEMASAGSKVMQSRSVEFAKKFGVRFEVRSSFNDNPGTMIINESAGMENVVIRGISVERNQAKVTVSGVPDRPGTAAAIFNTLAEAHVIIDMIVQNVSAGGATDISFTLNKADLPGATAALRPVVEAIGAAGLTARDGIAKLSVVGIGMRSHSGVAAKLFECLGRSGINIQMISTSEIKIAVIIEEAAVAEAANLTHTEFGLERGPYTV